MDARLYEKAIDGNVVPFLRLIEDDHDILDRIVVGGIAEETPLHVAAHFGHVDLVREILIKKPEFANILNCQGETPLHLASEKGHKEVVKALLQTNSDVCFIRDKEGRSPLHLAAIKGRVEVLEELVRARIKAAWISTDRKEPLLHLCVNHNQFDALKKLVELINDDEFMNMKDADDNNVFHLLAAKKQIKVIKFLVDKTKLDMNAKNVHDFTALDVTWIMIASLMGVYAFAYDTIRRKGVDEYRFWPIMMFAVLIVVIGYVAAFFWFLLRKTRAMLGDSYHWVKNQEWFSIVKLGSCTKAFGWNSRIFHRLKTPYDHDTTNGSTV